jgi:hypothetical protein
MSPATPASPPHPELPPEHGDDGLHLPPLDGATGDEPDEPGAEPLADDEVPEDDGGDPFDDATGEGDAAPELVGAEDESGWLVDAGEADALDIGAHDLVGGVEGERLTDDGREPDAPHDEYDLLEDAAATALDGGEEGPSTDDESLTDEALPALGGEGEDDVLGDASAFFDGELGQAPGRAPAPQHDAWASEWERFGSPLSLPPTRALACAPDGVLSAGNGLVRVDLEGATSRMAGRGLRGGEATRVLRSSDALYVTTETGGLFLSRDAGATFAELAGWRELVRPDEAAAGLDVVAGSDGTLWGRTAQGGLLWSADGGEHWVKEDVDGFVRALGTDERGQPVVLVRALGASEVLRRAPRPGATWSRRALPNDIPLDGHASIIAHGDAVALAIEAAGVFRSCDGAAWSPIAATEATTAMAMLDGAGALVLALPSTEGDGQSAVLRLARVGTDGALRVVAVWGERGAMTAREVGEGGVLAIAVDHAHQVVWVAGGFGVAAFQPSMRSLS